MTHSEQAPISIDNPTDLTELIPQLDPDVLARLKEVADQLPTILEMGEVGRFKEFTDLIDSIFEIYPVKFDNGIIDSGESKTLSANYKTFTNKEGDNLGSLKVFAFAIMMGYTAAQALALFGEYYNDVLEDPDGDSHPNIRQVHKHGLEGVRIHGMPFRIT